MHIGQLSSPLFARLNRQVRAFYCVIAPDLTLKTKMNVHHAKHVEEHPSKAMDYEDQVLKVSRFITHPR